MMDSVPIRRLDRTLHGIQYLRAIAALMVLVFHAFQVRQGPLTLLGTGVDLFFVLSGFLMMTITDASTRPWPFLVARLRRIVPLYWLVTTLSVLLLWGGVSWHSPIPFWQIAQYTHEVPVARIAASYGFVPWWNEGAKRMMHPVVPLGWTLNLEMMFYLLVSLSLLLSRRWQFAALSFVISGLAVTGMFKIFPHPPLAGWTDPVILEFLVGAWIGWVWQHSGKLWRALFVAAIAVTAFAAFRTQYGTSSGEDIRFILSIPYAALLILVLGVEDRAASVPRLTLALFLGNASYAIYLVQFPVQLLLEREGIARGAFFAVSMICLTLMSAAAMHRFIEVPIMRHGRPNRDTGRDKAHNVRA